MKMVGAGQAAVRTAPSVCQDQLSGLLSAQENSAGNSSVGRLS